MEDDVLEEETLSDAVEVVDAWKLDEFVAEDNDDGVGDAVELFVQTKLDDVVEEVFPDPLKQTP
jgi:hypothetical protein